MNKLEKILGSAVLSVPLMLGDVSVNTDKIGGVEIGINQAEATSYNMPDVLDKSDWLWKPWVIWESNRNHRSKKVAQKMFDQEYATGYNMDYLTHFPPWIVAYKIKTGKGLGGRYSVMKEKAIRKNPSLGYLVEGYDDFLHNYFKSAEKNLSLALFLNAQKIGYKPFEDANELASNFRNKSSEEMRIELDEIAKHLPKEIHLEAIYSSKHKKEHPNDKCNDAYLTYQSAGLLAMDYAMLDKREMAQGIISSNLYQNSKNTLKLSAFDKKLKF